MKKIVTLGVVAAITTALCITAYADNSSNVVMAQKISNVKSGIISTANVNQIKLETKTIKGTVKEVNSFGVKLTAEDGKVYLVPTAMFEDSEEYKSMNLKVGDKIIVEGLDFEKIKGNLKFSVKADVEKGVQENVVIFREAVPAEKIEKAEKANAIGIFVESTGQKETLKLNEGEELFHGEKITANGVTVDLPKMVSSVAATKAIEFETKTIKGTVKEINEFGIRINAEGGKTYIVPTGIIAASQEFKSMNLKEGDSILVEGPDFDKMMKSKDGQNHVVFSKAPVSLSIGSEIRNMPKDTLLEKVDFVVETADQINTIKLDKNDIIFSADKITANGVTIDVQKFVTNMQQPIRIHVQPKGQPNN